MVLRAKKGLDGYRALGPKEGMGIVEMRVRSCLNGGKGRWSAIIDGVFFLDFVKPANSIDRNRGIRKRWRQKQNFSDIKVQLKWATTTYAG